MPRDTEINDAGGSVFRNQDVGRFQVAVNDSLQMRMKHRLAESAKEAQPVFDGVPGLAAVIGEAQSRLILASRWRSNSCSRATSCR